MKKILIYVLVLLMAFSGGSVLAESNIGLRGDGSQLTVANSTPFTGNFFARMWGNLTSDLDVQLLVHGYTLVRWNSASSAFEADPSVVTGIATTENEEGDRVYSVALYNDLYYSDGTQITAWDYVFSILLSIAPQVAEIGGSPEDKAYIVGCQDYLSGAADSLAGVHVLNDRMFSVTVSREYLPFYYELGLLSFTPYPISVIAPGCTVQDQGQGVFIDGPFTADLLRETILDETTGYLTHPSVSSGPYTLVSYDGTQAEFAINKQYKWNAEDKLPTISRLYYRTVEKDQMMELLTSGEVGLLNKVVSADLVDEGLDLAKGTAFAATSYPRTGLAYITFCCEQDTVSSPAVRQALSYCFDKDAFISGAVGDCGVRVDGYFGVGQWMYQMVSGAADFPVTAPAANASAEAMQQYEDEIGAWEALTMDGTPIYDPAVEEAIRLLEADGWTLNRSGEPFDAAQDDVRCKEIDGELVALDLTLLCPEENGFGELLQEAFVGLEDVGVQVTVQNLPMQEVLKSYYREVERDCDLIFMASNFDVVYDPSITFMPDGDEPNPYNFSAINDEELYALAVEMRLTQPDDALGYVAKWIDFQARLQDVAPIISIYSNTYYDFYTKALKDYHIESCISWGQAIVNARLEDVR